MSLMPAWPAPDHPSWHNHHDFSPALARILPQAFALLSTNLLADYNQALELVLPFIPQTAVAPQRLRVCYIVASCLAAFDQYDEALVWLDEALDLALLLRDDNAALDLIILRSGLNRALLHVGEAAGDLHTALALLDQKTLESHTTQAGLKLHFTAHLAGFEYYLGRYATAETLVAEARTLARDAYDTHDTHDTRDALLDAATVEWVQTHLYRLRGRPEEALRTSLAAATVFTEAGSPISAARAQALVAEVAMDFVAMSPADADRSAFLKLAWPHLSMATSLAHEAHDPVGSLMVRLTRIRYGRLRRSNENRIAMIETVIRKARKLGDIALVAEAFTTLGDELAADGESESALNLYRQVVAMLDGGDFPAVGIEARRALIRASEW